MATAAMGLLGSQQCAPLLLKHCPRMAAAGRTPSLAARCAAAGTARPASTGAAEGGQRRQLPEGVPSFEDFLDGAADRPAQHRGVRKPKERCARLPRGQ